MIKEDENSGCMFGECKGIGKGFGRGNKKPECFQGSCSNRKKN